MKLTFAELSSTGPVRHHNEDSTGFWQPESEDERLVHGSIAAVADGVGGLSSGEIASRMAIDIAINTFKGAGPNSKPNQVLEQIFKEANLDIYNFGVESEQRRMGTTLTACIFRNKELSIGHVGDCRVYLVRNGQVKKLTSDHTYVEMQRKLGLISQEEAMSSELRSVLTRSLGQNPIVQMDFVKSALMNRDSIIICSDGLHNLFMEHEIADVVRRMDPAQACEHLIATAENRGAEDNISVQVVRVDEVKQTAFYRGLAALYPSPEREQDAPVTTNVEVGQVLDDRFEIVESIHRSAMSTVFKAMDRKTGEMVALKVPLMNVEADPAFYSRFEREEEIGKVLDHPGILKIIPVEQKSRPYIVMEFVKGQTLDRLMQRVGILPIADTLKIASRLCDALEYMHKQGVIHRDMKPSNVMLCDDGSLRIMDFGIAKTEAMRRITFGGFSPTMGTPDYMAPEQIKGKRGDARTDIYSLGAILYEMLTGQVPFQGPNVYAVMNARLVGDPAGPRTLNPEIPPQVEEIVLHAMDMDPFKRFQSAAAMKADLDNWEAVQITHRHQRLRRAKPWKRRIRQIRMYVITGMIPIVMFLLLWFLLSRQTPHH
ncbi:MAG TPA: protein kinase [Terriglobia bacterium]|nr:protein kinase [Terriglobia bacterium]